MENVYGIGQRTLAPIVCRTIESNVWRIESSSPRFVIHSVGAQHAEVCFSPIS